jgi:glycyl-tRNA synthetase alpha chain
MDARGAIAVAERQSYIGRIRDLCKATAAAWVE